MDLGLGRNRLGAEEGAGGDSLRIGRSRLCLTKNFDELRENRVSRTYSGPEMETQEIQEVIGRVLAGETREFSRLVREFGLPVRAFIHSRVQSRPDAEDLAQETFIAAFRGLGKFDKDASFEAWLIGIARHRVQGHFRSTHRWQSACQRFRDECLRRIETEISTAEKQRTHEQLTRLMECIEELPDRMRRVVRARLREESGATTAQRMHTSPGAVYMLQLRANGFLRDCMTQEPT